MAARLPVLGDFPNVTLSIDAPPASQKPVNILILLHGLGDSVASFRRLGQQLALPETACLAIQGPTPLPFETGSHQWADDLIFDSSTGGLDPDGGFKASTELLVQRVLDPLVQTCHYSLRNVLMFGFGQGGTAALAAAAALPTSDELAGIVSVGGPLPAVLASVSRPSADSTASQTADLNTTAPESAGPGTASSTATSPAASSTVSDNAKSRTPVLLAGGSSETLLTDDAVERVRRVFAHVEYRRWRRPTDAMPRNRDEMMPLMQLFARRLQSRQGIPEGAIKFHRLYRF